jgi:cell division control protein 7
MGHEQASSLSFGDFTVIESLGTGRFSNVYLVKSSVSGKEYALKDFFWNVRPEEIAREAKMMRRFRHNNIPRVIALLRQENHCAMVLSFHAFTNFRLLIDQFSGAHLLRYLHDILSALKELHESNVIHGDVKPSNFLFNPSTKHGTLIDFGFSREFQESSHTEHPNPLLEEDLSSPAARNRNRFPVVRFGTRGFRAPELLMSVSNPTTAVDIWGVGVIFLSFITQRYPFFVAEDDLTALCQIAAIFGSDKVQQAAAECGRRIRFPKWVPTRGMQMTDLVLILNPTLKDKTLNSDAFDLLTKMLELSPSKRITAKDALLHPFFSPRQQSLQVD